MSPSFQTKILFFLKAPRPGFVKTRLAKDIGEQAACEIYRDLVSYTLAQIPENVSTVINFAPANALAEFHDWLGEGFEYSPQPEGDLGDRMSHACQQAFESGADAVILLGGDCPSITTEHLETIIRLLKNGENVLGPAKDGGYWTMGLTRPFPEVFQDIPWSTEVVAELTREKFQDFNRELTQVDTLEDVDNLESWKRNQIFLTQN